MKQIYWVFPDRSSARQGELERTLFWHEYEEAARQVGLNLRVISPEAINVIYYSDHTTRTYVSGRNGLPENTIFVTELQNFPHHQRDALLEVHPNPDNALSDGFQSITLSDFDTLVERISQLQSCGMYRPAAQLVVGPCSGPSWRACGHGLGRLRITGS